ncbi:hypothetical protein HJ588_04415 [Flexivirga sp. ID2601S]|uniref:Uncharacterized protein n=1 Tax=Flexivirga aerilata TaxID=1656889 RepID=A0A849ADI7_9MICO|nr:hypothetical protein [Flexivirga aerilata]NNG38519.1 hypothetical protein [Flexivirga aerilata]
MTEDVWSAERRRVARRLHPDLGGDPDDYIAAMQALEQRRAAAMGVLHGAEGMTVVHTTAGSRAVRAVTGRARSVTTAVRRHLPRGWPGARRYGQL